MRLFDSMTREVRELRPVEGDTFRFYCCGPTVYGPAHIGNFRTFVMNDVLRRVLEVGGTKTYHVRNITDVDDKTIRDSEAAGETLKAFTGRWLAQFHDDCEKLNCLPPHLEPSAVEHIPQQIQMIEELVAKGHAYAPGDGSVYFKISSFPEYGKLSRLDTRELDLGKTQSERAGELADEYEKDSISDFVLWKGKRDGDGDNFWDSPWGPGRPGWHLECSAMIREYLGDTFDLHSGGEDLAFPHHENEIAQSQCCCGGQFALHWFHGAHLLVNGKKMSKSAGTVFTIADLEAKGFTAGEVRYELLSAYYRKQANFTLESLHAKREALGKLAKVEAELRAKVGESEVPAYQDLLGLASFGVFAEAWSKLENDLNTAAAIGALFTGIKTAATKEDWLGLHGILAALGLVLPVLEEDGELDIPENVRALAEARWAARSAKDWAKSDELRDALKDLGWVAKDGREGYELERL
ncbi:cysteine--tRNA ligase [Roseibacillus persicicus]|uniref:cysteine--tRNA ligase n=1 Tax=Roseibacillus persicicus TaxID=454148 RepID=UPI00280E2F64|nr:cysteine--tRNA ligase [Roseibacillus persicicus]MDQ8189874.1 cysteine--tRNA ligase [Roseibacillus persicicus]